jgi:protoporphyrinogen oxidase
LDTWIYLHNPEIVAGRMQNFKSWGSDMRPGPATTCPGLEYFCFESDSLWTLDDEELVKLDSRDLQVLKLCQPARMLGADLEEHASNLHLVEPMAYTIPAARVMPW